MPVDGASNVFLSGHHASASDVRQGTVPGSLSTAVSRSHSVSAPGGMAHGVRSTSTISGGHAPITSQQKWAVRGDPPVRPHGTKTGGPGLM
jgi:hypothetical protein